MILVSLFAVSMVIPISCIAERSASALISAKLLERAETTASVSFRYHIENTGVEPYPIIEGEVNFLLPDHYLNIYRTTLEPGQPPIPGIMLQKGREFTTVELVFGSYVESAVIKRYCNLPPMRGEGFYLAGSLFFGNGSFAHGLNSFLKKGKGKITGRQVVQDKACINVELSSDQPGGAQAQISLDEQSAFPRQITEKSFEKGLVTTITSLTVNPDLKVEDFDVDIPSTLGIEPSLCQETCVDYGCVEVKLDEVKSLAGFEAVCPRIKGYKLYGVYWTDPKAYGPGADDPAYHAFYKECYLVLRNDKGNRQIEVCEAKEYQGYDEKAGSVGLTIEGDICVSPCLNEEISVGGKTVFMTTHVHSIKAAARKGGLKIKVSGDIDRQGMLDLMSDILR